MELINVFFLFCALLLFFSVLASSISARIGMPLLLGFLAIGILVGEDGILGLEFSSFGLANIIAQLALALILLDGGLRTSIATFRVALKPASVMATWGVLVTVFCLGLFVSWLLNLDWRLAMLMAAIVGSTDAGAVFSLLRNGGVSLNERVQSTLEIESGANDPMAILLVTAFIALNLDPNNQTLVSFVWLLVKQLGLGLILGYLGGFLLTKMLSKVQLADAMYALLIMSGGLGLFAFTNIMGGSGFLTVYLAGVLVGNYQSRATNHVLNVMDGIAWLSQATLFVMLGMLVTPTDVLKVWHYGLAVTVFLVLVARPIAVVTGLLPFGFKKNELMFISWVGLRGAVPVTLAIIPVMMGVEQSILLFDITFAVVVLSLLVQGSSLPFFAKRLKVLLPDEAKPKGEYRIWLNDHASIRIFEFEVVKHSFAINQHPETIAHAIDANEVRLFAFVRRGKLTTLNANIRLQIGDSVWFAVRGDHADALSHIFGDNMIKERQDSEFFGSWIVSPHIRLCNLPLLELDEIEADNHQKTVLEYIEHQNTSNLVIGDSIDLTKNIKLVVRHVDNWGQITAVGVKKT
ncbi:potassium/proton antiporter [Moraxella macacae 0408225]|uniref:Potassium/proton antiporter n=1 Tax=Moraxella macacae 0408225 TaxID=1230338 RepID=L2F9T7_9GAMM|nr:potassium/proton antiporter [Moraxella macacae]ELA09650.1 potassium/proton antiporter [Moraxella macacae 0408225]